MNILRREELGRKSPAQISSDSTVVGKPLPEAWSRIVPGEDLASPQLVYAASQKLVEAGLSVIPIEAYEGSKSPDAMRLPHPHDRISGRPKPSWSIYQMRRPTHDELRGWFEISGPYGLAVVCGTVSGGLEVIDFDTAELAGPWMEAVERELPGLLPRLVRIGTPRPGLHVYFRCSQYTVNQKLAFAPAVDGRGQPALDASGRPSRKTTIETRGEGGYALIPPTPPRCHPTNRVYRYAEGSPNLADVPTITPEERAILLNAARALNQWKEPEIARKPAKSSGKRAGLLLPGDDFNARARWDEILTPHGWTFAGAYGDEERWCRPGKDGGGVSATVNHGGCGLLHVFTSNADKFEADGSYTKFAAFTLLNHDGDFEAAARDLRAQGYGAKSLKAGKR